MKPITLAAISFVVGLLVLPLVVYLYFSFGRPPVAAGDPPLLMEEQIVKVPLRARIQREMPASSPIPQQPMASQNM